MKTKKWGQTPQNIFENIFVFAEIFTQIFTTSTYFCAPSGVMWTPSEAKKRRRLSALVDKQAELGTSLFEIALSLFALERTFILRAMALLEAKSEAL